MLLTLLACVHAVPVPPAPPAASAPMGPELYVPERAAAVLTPLKGEVPVAPDMAAVGPADAAVVIVTFSDFQCPFCAHLFPLLEGLAERRPDLRIVFGSFPLNKNCNPLVQSEMHRYACDAAVAAACANAQGRYLPLAELLYTYPDQITPPAMPLFADRAGLDLAAFAACQADPATTATLAAHVATAVSLGVEGTPTVFARGLAGPGWVQVSGEAGAIVAALEAAPRH